MKTIICPRCKLEFKKNNKWKCGLGWVCSYCRNELAENVSGDQGRIGDFADMDELFADDSPLEDTEFDTI